MRLNAARRDIDNITLSGADGFRNTGLILYSNMAWKWGFFFLNSEPDDIIY